MEGLGGNGGLSSGGEGRGEEEGGGGGGKGGGEATSVPVFSSELAGRSRALVSGGSCWKIRLLGRGEEDDTSCKYLAQSVSGVDTSKMSSSSLTLCDGA